MSNVHRIRDRAAIDDEAAQWVWRLDADEVSPQTESAYRAWLEADPRHREAMEEYTKVWHRLDDLAVLKSASKVRTVRRGVNEEERQRLFPVPLRWLRFAAAAAVLSVAVFLTYHFGGPGMRASLVTNESYATAIGQQRTIELADGSVVELNTNSIVDVAFTRSERLVRLNKGEAHFAVEKNPDRPFIVEAGDTRVRAVGTAFSVYVAPQLPVQVIVTEGEVAVIDVPPAPSSVSPVSAEARPTPQAVHLEAGERLGNDTDAPRRVMAVSSAEMTKELAWRNGMLIFEGDPLEFVVEELSRYTQARFVIVDDSIRERRVGGRFKTDDVEGLLSVLEKGLAIEVRRQGNSIILLADANKG